MYTAALLLFSAGKMYSLFHSLRTETLGNGNPGVDVEPSNCRMPWSCVTPLHSLSVHKHEKMDSVASFGTLPAVFIKEIYEAD